MGITDDQPWDMTDFLLNKRFWKGLGHEASLPFRVRNLVDVQDILESAGIESALYGRTLRDTFSEGKLMEDHDDDLVVSVVDFLKIRDGRVLARGGFRMIRKERSMLSIVRDNRYIDIHVLAAEFGERRQLVAHGQSFWVLNESADILHEKYGKNHQTPARPRLSAKIGRVRHQLASTPPRKWAPSVIRYLFRLGKINRASAPVLSPTPISLDEFLDLQIDGPESINWTWRQSHLERIFQRGETFRRALARLAGDPPRPDEVCDTPLETQVEEPVNSSRLFWKRGDNFFINPFLYGFRHLVLPYHAANAYIRAERGPVLYSKEYYLGLPEMSDLEIRSFLEQNPIEVTNGAVTSGRHRAAAMLGRLHRGQTYIPLFATDGPH